MLTIAELVLALIFIVGLPSSSVDRHTPVKLFNGPVEYLDKNTCNVFSRLRKGF